MSEHNRRELKPKIDRAIQDKIGRELRAMYEDLFRQALPENLMAPLRALDEVQSSRQRLAEALTAMRAHATTLSPMPLVVSPALPEVKSA